MKKNKGFVLVELVLVMGIILLLSGFVIFSLVGEQRNVSVSSLTDAVVSDIKSQQTKAMEGIGGQSGQAYGIYLEPTRYILFKGVTYSSSDASNFIVTLDPGIVIANITFPSNSIIFASKSGEINQYSSGNSSFTLEDTNGIKSKTVTLNRYGVIISEN